MASPDHAKSSPSPTAANSNGAAAAPPAPASAPAPAPASPANNPVVRVDQDSASNLEALFDTVLRPDSKRPLQVPFRMRALPPSFFNPPPTGSRSPSVSHSRDNSADSAFGSQPPAPSPQVAHSRAHSSPASLQQTYAVNVQQGGQQQQQQQQLSQQSQGVQPQPQQQPPANPVNHRHAKQRSYDVTSTLQQQQQILDDLGPLPYGWEQAQTPDGQIYFLNHTNCTTTWEDPRKSRQNDILNQTAVTVQTTQPTNTASKTGAVGTNGNGGGNDPLGALPEGWEQAATQEGDIYFIHHPSKTTTWYDPRIPQHLQRTPGTNVILPQGWSSSVLQTSQKLRLEMLQQERERLKQRQHEIRLQQEIIRSRQTPLIVSVATEIQMDPFLSGITEHTRQESGDSGLGMGQAQSYSMPHTPEDFLSNIDDNMDCVNENGSTTMDADLPLSDDLVPTLQLGEDFSSDILEDVQSLINPASSRPDNVLTWI